MYDIIVIGAGVTGTCTARELSKYQVNMCVIDKGDDVASGTSKANSGIVHGGYDCKPGTLMAEMNVRGNELLYELAEDLDYPIKKNGSLIVCTVPGERGKLDVLLEQAKENGVPGCRIIDKEEALKMEPNLTDNTVVASLPVILSKASAKNIPVFGSEIEQVKIGCLAAMGLDYVELGKQTGEMAAKVLKGEAKASELNFETIKDAAFYGNTKVAENLGITLPESLTGNAAELFDSITE